MAQKPVKKTPAKKAAAARKTTTKATAKKTAPVTDDVIIITGPDTQHDHAGCGCHHPCHCGCAQGNPCKCGGGFWRFIKKLFWFLVIFALGFAACALLCNNHGPRGPRGPKMPIEFVNGCLDMEKIPCPEMKTKLMAADVNNDGCVSREEYKAVKAQMRGRGGKRHAK